VKEAAAAERLQAFMGLLGKIICCGNENHQKELVEMNHGDTRRKRRSAKKRT
jgi:hypothetical protein